MVACRATRRKRNGEPALHDVAARLRQCRTIAIIGSEGSGKTSLAISLSSVLKLQFPDVDWPSGKEAEAKRKEIMGPLLQQLTWIVDGDFGLARYADAIIFLDFSRLLCMWFGTKRSVSNVLTWDLASAKVARRLLNRTKMHLGFLCAAYRHPAKERPRIVAQLDSFAQTACVVQLTSPKQVKALLDALTRVRHAGPAQERGAGTS